MPWTRWRNSPATAVAIGVLDGKDVPDGAIQAARPDLYPGAGIHQSRRDTKLFSGALGAAEYQIACTEASAGFLWTGGAVSDARGRAARDDREPRDDRKSIEDHFRDADGQVSVRHRRAQVFERQYGHGGVAACVVDGGSCRR